MKKLAIITGGGSGMGLETAKLLDDYSLILVGRTVEKLQGAVEELRDLNIEVEAFPADISDLDSVKRLVDHVLNKGQVELVFHGAGISPHMAEADKIFEINSMGTIYINQEFGKIMQGGCILNVASMAAYMLPEEQAPKDLYKLSLVNPQEFLGGAKLMLTSLPEESSRGAAYTISKHFVRWFTEKMALKFGNKGLRVVSISPGTFSTPMGILEGDQAEAMALMGALGRMGEPKEIAKMINFILRDSYLTGADVLYDGGSIAAVKEQQAQ